MNIKRKKQLPAILLSLTLTVTLCGCGTLPGLSRPVSEIAIAIEGTERSRITISWDSAALPVEQADVTVTPDGAVAVTLLPLPQK